MDGLEIVVGRNGEPYIRAIRPNAIEGDKVEKPVQNTNPKPSKASLFFVFGLITLVLVVAFKITNGR